jgi:hypothetical protein
MELFSNLSDDQIALLGCATALVTTGTVMCLSYFIGRGRMQSSRVITTAPATSDLAQPMVGAAAEDSKHRSAA